MWPTLNVKEGDISCIIKMIQYDIKNSLILRYVLKCAVTVIKMVVNATL